MLHLEPLSCCCFSELTAHRVVEGGTRLSCLDPNQYRPSCVARVCRCPRLDFGMGMVDVRAVGSPVHTG